jgi:hypothetical protein
MCAGAGSWAVTTITSDRGCNHRNAVNMGISWAVQRTQPLFPEVLQWFTACE